MIKEIIKNLYNYYYKDDIAAINKEISDLKDKILSLQTPKNLDVPKSYGVITWQEELKILGVFNCGINLTDDYLQATTVDEAKRFVEESKIQYNAWVSEDYDCDNFSASLYGYWSDSLKSFAFGMARSSNHQFNIMIDKDKNIWIVEPQTAEFMTIEQSKTKSLDYKPVLIWM